MMMRIFLAFHVALVAASVASVASHSFIVSNDSFVKDGEPFQIISGSMHYSRCPQELWRDRLQRMRAMGLNAVQTYVPWNWHEEEKDVVQWSGDRNLTLFLETAHEEGLLVLLRAGPYICGEWEFGGFPAWLLDPNAYPNVSLRTDEPSYMSAVTTWFEALFPVVKPMIYSAGGPVVMLQVENEYGSYGNVAENPADKSYLKKLIDLANKGLGQSRSGEKILLYTTDGGNTGYMTKGSLNGSEVITLGDGGPGPAQGIWEAESLFNPPGMRPRMDTEDYTGWLTHWTEKMAIKPSPAIETDITNILASGARLSLTLTLTLTPTLSLILVFRSTWSTGVRPADSHRVPTALEARFYLT